MSGDIFGCHDWGRRCYWHLGGGQRCYSTCYSAQSPHQSELALDASGASWDLCCS